jgi:transposase
VTQLLLLVESIPPVRGKVGAPQFKPEELVADRGYDSNPHRATLRQQGIKLRTARQNTAHGSGLGVIRWVVEPGIALLHQFRRLKMRFDKRDDIHEGFMAVAEAFICSRRLIAS